MLTDEGAARAAATGRGARRATSRRSTCRRRSRRCSPRGSTRSRAKERSVIEPASVVGYEFAEAAVTALAPPDVSPRRPTRSSRRSTHKHLVRRVEDGDEGVHRFDHIMIRDTAYDGILKRARADLHERFVAWADLVNQDRGAEFEEILGYHLEQAWKYLVRARPARRAGPRDRAGGLTPAGRRPAGARSPAATSRARSALLGRAAALLPDGRSRAGAAAARARRGAAHDGSLRGGDRGARRGDRARGAVCPRPRRARRSSGSSSGCGPVAPTGGGATRSTREIDARDARLRAAAATRRAGDGVAPPGLVGRHGVPVRRCRRGLERGGRACRNVPETCARSGARPRAMPAPHSSARRTSTRRSRGARRRSSDGRRPPVGGQPLGCSAALYAMQGAFDHARGLVARARVAARGARARPGRRARRHRGVAGRDARRRARGCRARAPPVVRRPRRARRAVRPLDRRRLLAQTMLERGRPARRGRGARRAEPRARHRRRHRTQALWRCVQGRVLARRGALDEAEAIVREAMELLEPTDATVLQIDAQLDLGEVLDHGRAARRSASAYETRAGARGDEGQRRDSSGRAPAASRSSTPPRVDRAGSPVVYPFVPDVATMVQIFVFLSSNDRDDAVTGRSRTWQRSRESVVRDRRDLVVLRQGRRRRRGR